MSIAAGVAAKTVELVVILTPLAKEDGGASRHPGPLDTRLHVPDVGLVGIAVDDAGSLVISLTLSTGLPFLVLKDLKLRAVIVLSALVQAIDKQAGWAHA